MSSTFLADAFKCSSFVLIVIAIVHIMLNKVVNDDDHGYVAAKKQEPTSFRQKVETYVEPIVKEEEDHDELYEFVHANTNTTTTTQPVAATKIQASDPKPPPPPPPPQVTAFNGGGSFGDSFESWK